MGWSEHTVLVEKISRCPEYIARCKIERLGRGSAHLISEERDLGFTLRYAEED